MRCPFAVWRPSPNFQEGRTQEISWVAEHSTVATLAGTLRIFDGLTSRNVSAHFTIALHEDLIIQHVDTDDTAWHAADQNHNANPYSIGVEHVDDTQHWDPERTPIQYANSVRLNQWILEAHDLDLEAIGRHRDRISTACPSGLDVERIIAELGGTTMPTQQEWLAHLSEDLNTDTAIKEVLSDLAHAKHPEHVLGASTARALRKLDAAVTRKHKFAARTILAAKKKPTRAQVRAGHGR